MPIILILFVFLYLKLLWLISHSLRAWTLPVSVPDCCVWTLRGQTKASTVLSLQSRLPLEVLTSTRLCRLIEATAQLSYLHQLVEIPHESNVDYWRWYWPHPLLHEDRHCANLLKLLKLNFWEDTWQDSTRCQWCATLLILDFIII